MPLARISLTLSRHFSLSFIASGSFLQTISITSLVFSAFKKIISHFDKGSISCFLLIFCTYVVPSISFLAFFVQAFKIDVDSWQFSMLLLYILWDDWPISMISGPNEQLQQELEYTLLKPDCHWWWISKMQSGHEDTLEERYAIKLCFKLGKNVWNASDCFWSVLHELSISFWVG